MTTITVRRDFEARFWGKVHRTDSCWTWSGSRSSAGYGNFKLDGQVVYAHRLSYEISVGPIPEGMYLDHLCRVRNCVNPDHLEPVANGENVRRGQKGFSLTGTCQRGHDMADPSNVYIRPTGRRQCRRCLVALGAQRRKARAA